VTYTKNIIIRATDRGAIIIMECARTALRSPHEMLFVLIYFRNSFLTMGVFFSSFFFFTRTTVFNSCAAFIAFAFITALYTLGGLYSTVSVSRFIQMSVNIPISIFIWIYRYFVQLPFFFCTSDVHCCSSGRTPVLQSRKKETREITR